MSGHELLREVDLFSDRIAKRGDEEGMSVERDDENPDLRLLHRKRTGLRAESVLVIMGVKLVFEELAAECPAHSFFHEEMRVKLDARARRDLLRARRGAGRGDADREKGGLESES